MHADTIAIKCTFAIDSETDMECSFKGMNSVTQAITDTAFAAVIDRAL